MGEFEKWFIDQDFYTNMRFIHGDNLFSKDGDVYRVLPVQMTYKAWSEKQSEYAELKEVSVALNTETINQRRYMASQQSKIERLEKQKQHALQELSGLSRFTNEDCVEDFEFLKGAVLSACARIEKALRGDSCG